MKNFTQKNKKFVMIHEKYNFIRPGGSFISKIWTLVWGLKKLSPLSFSAAKTEGGEKTGDCFLTAPEVAGY